MYKTLIITLFFSFEAQYSIFSPTQDSNPGGRIQNHKRWPLHYHCTQCLHVPFVSFSPGIDVNRFATGDAYMCQLFHCLQRYAGSERVKLILSVLGITLNTSVVVQGMTVNSGQVFWVYITMSLQRLVDSVTKVSKPDYYFCVWNSSMFSSPDSSEVDSPIKSIFGYSKTNVFVCDSCSGSFARSPTSMVTNLNYPLNTGLFHCFRIF